MAPGADDLRHAASAIVARDGEDRLEVLVVERGGESRFLPGYVAFPGGATEPQDEELSRRWFGTADEPARACALRELLEEVGLAVTADGVDGSTDRSPGAVAPPPTLDQLPEVARWIAPPRVPVRFDARYFAVRAPGGLPVAPDGGEIAAAWWAAPGDLLEGWRTGTRKLYWPTYFTVEAISRCSDVDQLLALRIETREPGADDLERLPRSTFWQG